MSLKLKTSLIDCWFIEHRSIFGYLYLVFGRKSVVNRAYRSVCGGKAEHLSGRSVSTVLSFCRRKTLKISKSPALRGFLLPLFKRLNALRRLGAYGKSQISLPGLHIFFEIGRIYDMVKRHLRNLSHNV